MSQLVILNKTQQYQKPDDLIDRVKIGQWYWCKDVDCYGEKHNQILFCVDEIGSNFIGFVRKNKDSSWGFQLHFDEFMERCALEENWKVIFQKRASEIQELIKEKIKELIKEGQKLSLISNNQSPEKSNINSLLPVISNKTPEKYKQDLIIFKENKMPAIQKEIEELSIEYAVITKNIALPDLVRLETIKEALKTVEDRIFTVELYCGLQETVHQITDGEPAKINEPICIRQQLLFMDEETLFDYNDGGMDFKKLEDFDNWIVKSENLNRILPEQKGIVAFRIRRYKKDYDSPSNLIEAWVQIHKDAYNMETYLLIRNGDKVFRIASAIDFTPRLVPFKDEIGEKQFTIVDEYYTHDNSEDPFERKQRTEKVTVDDIRYDKHAKKQSDLIKKYNRIFIFIQGLLDRSQVFHPHLGIKLSSDDHMNKYLKCIRDEETGLTNKTITWKEYRDQINKTLRTGNLVWSNWHSDKLGRYSGHNARIIYNQWEYEIVNRPKVCK
ncbi:hypothetical protein LCGC14_2331640, partial [marine sediment metagenome]